MVDTGKPPENLPEIVPVQMKSKMLKAVKASEYSMVWALLSKGANPDDCEDPNGAGWSPLHWAAKDGSVAICQLLVSKGANINVKDKSGQTPLHRAAYWGRIQVVDFLVYVGAALEVVDSANSTAADVARQRNNQEVFAYLQQQKQGKQTTTTFVSLCQLCQLSRLSLLLLPLWSPFLFPLQAGANPPSRFFFFLCSC